MTREEEIKRKAHLRMKDFSFLNEFHSNKQIQIFAYNRFLEGANWADQHPRKGLWDAEKVIEWLRNNSSKYMTEGINYPHYAYNALVDDLTKAMED